MSYWIQVNENKGLISRELGDRKDITLIEDAGFVLLVADDEDTVVGFAAAACLTISDEGEGKPDLGSPSGE